MNAEADAGIGLVLLKCPRCGMPPAAEEGEAAWVCEQCGQGLRLTADGLAEVAVRWAAARAGTTGAAWYPFWTFTATVRFEVRDAYGGGRRPDALWQRPLRFYVPAFQLDFAALQALGAYLTRKQPKFAAGTPAGRPAGCILTPADALAVAEFIVLTIEAEQKDKLRRIGFALEVSGEPELWLLPFSGQPEPRTLAT